MSKQMGFSEYYEILSKKTNEIRTELEENISNYNDEIPFLDEIKDTDSRYIAYSKAVKTSINFGRLLSTCYFTKDAIIRVKQKLQKDTTNPAKIITLWIRDCDNLIQDVDGLLLSAKTFKECLDNVIRFYQSACYMFGGIFEVKSSI